MRCASAAQSTESDEEDEEEETDWAADDDDDAVAAAAREALFSLSLASSYAFWRLARSFAATEASSSAFFRISAVKYAPIARMIARVLPFSANMAAMA
jgi:hypothetical protein